MKTRTLLLPLLALLAASPLHAVPAVPEIINYQGYVTNAAGAALPDGNYDIFFRIYNVAIGGTALWAEKQTVTVSGGQFSVMLGNGVTVGTTNHDPLGTFLTTNAATGNLFIGLSVNAVGQSNAAEFAPRQQLVANPFAHHAKLADTATVVAGNGVGTTALAASAVTSAKIADLNVTTAKIADGNITSAKLADNSVTGAKIVDATVAAADLAANAVTSVKLADGSVTSAKLAAGSVLAANIAPGSVGTAQMANSSVTAEKLAPAVIGSSQLADGSVTNGKLAADAVTSATLANGSVTAAKLAGAAVSPANTTFASQAGSTLTLNPTGTDTATAPVLTISNASIRASAPTETLANPFRVRQQLTTSPGFSAGAYECGFQIVKVTNLTQTSPGLRLQLLNPNGTVAGGAFLSSTGNWNTTSDARWKKDIHTADGLLGKALKLRPAWFRFKAQEDTAPETLGFIAQEVEKVLPNFVTRTDDRLTLDYSGLSTVAIGAVQEQQSLIEKQSAQIKDLEAKNAALEERLARLEKAMLSVAAK